DVGSTLIIVRADGFIRCAHYHSVAADRDRSSVETSRSGIAGVEFLLQRPDRAAARKDIGRRLIGVPGEEVSRGHYHGIAADRDRRAEGISREIAGGEPLLQRPDRAATSEDVGRTLIDV